MDAYEAARIVFFRIQSVDPENASKIMGYLLIQDHGDKEMIRLAFGPEALLQSIVLKARNDLGLHPPTSRSTPTLSSSPFHPSSLLHNNVTNFMSTSSAFSSAQLLGLHHSLNAPVTSWPTNSTAVLRSNFQGIGDADHLDEFGNVNSYGANMTCSTPPATASTSSLLQGVPHTSGTDLLDDSQFHAQLSFLNDSGSSPISSISPSGRPKITNGGDHFYSLESPTPLADGGMSLPSGVWGVTGSHRRSYSVADLDLLGAVWKPCLYFARGYCKNGASCRFLHGLPDSELDGKQLDTLDYIPELLRSRSQRLNAASNLMPPTSFACSTTNKCVNYLLQQQNESHRSTAAASAAAMLGDDPSKSGRTIMTDRNDFATGIGSVSPGSRQIYLTFPADSTFREEDVSNYFSIYGPVQDVRIPYQQKRMFGFVTFIYPETVKLILAKGNPHFVCDARVLVKPYKEKGKIAERKQQQYDRGDLSVCSSFALEPRDTYDFQQLGSRLMSNSHELVLRQKLEEQASLQRSLELHARRLMNMQLDLKKGNHPPIGPIISPCSSTDPKRSGLDLDDGFQVPPAVTRALDANQQSHMFDQDLASRGDEASVDENCSEQTAKPQESGNGIHNLPDSPFSFPTGKCDGGQTLISADIGTTDTDNSTAVTVPRGSAGSVVNVDGYDTTTAFPSTSTFDASTFKSCLFQIPGFSSDRGTIGM